jgi:hypothetical protein
MFAYLQDGGSTGGCNMRVFKCPACGERNRVPEGRQVKHIRCKACEHRFPSADNEPFEEPSAKPAVGPNHHAKSTLVQRVFGDPSAALEGAITGLAGGICAGVFGVILVGILSGQSFGDIVAGALMGFMVGFAVGALLGALLGGWGRRKLRPDSRIAPGWALGIAGALIGSIVGLTVERFWWFLVTALIGSAGTYLWPILWGKLEAAVSSPSDTTEEEDLLGKGRAEKAGRDFERKETRHTWLT